MAVLAEHLRIWDHFVRCPGAFVGGSSGIASAHAIWGLLQVQRRCRPQAILEIGAGIGTLTHTLAVNHNNAVSEGSAVWSIENHPFCLEQLERNLGEVRQRVNIVSSVKEIDRGQLFDLIVVDGGGDLPNDTGRQDFGGRLASGGLIFVEGSRRAQRDRLMGWYRDRGIASVRSAPLRKQIVAPTVPPVLVKNKPFHLFACEPSVATRGLLLNLRIRSLVVRALQRLPIRWLPENQRGKASS